MKHNNFDFLRLFAALSVLASHQYALLKLDEPVVMPGQSLGGLGVCIFFSISGYLVTQSWTRDPNIFRFLLKRFLRIWPALIVVTLLCALVLGPVATSLPLSDYLRAPGVRGFFATLWMKIVFSLPGVFTTIPYPNAINGSLWTIPLEVRCYLILAVLGLARVLRLRGAFLLATVALGAYYVFIRHEPMVATNDYLMRFGLFFCLGACMHLFKDWRESGMMAVIIGVCAFTALATKNYFLAQLLIISFATVSIGDASTPVLRRCGRFGDLSYGVYIYAFPTQQTLIWATNGHLTVFTYMILAAVATLALAYASWHVVEARAMTLKPRRRRTDSTSSDAATENALSGALPSESIPHSDH